MATRGFFPPPFVGVAVSAAPTNATDPSPPLQEVCPKPQRRRTEEGGREKSQGESESSLLVFLRKGEKRLKKRAIKTPFLRSTDTFKQHFYHKKGLFRALCFFSSFTPLSLPSSNMRSLTGAEKGGWKHAGSGFNGADSFLFSPFPPKWEKRNRRKHDVVGEGGCNLSAIATSVNDPPWNK